MRGGNSDMLILRGTEVSSLLNGKELELIETVRAAYEAHAAGDSSLPHSNFLRFPDRERERIIALPAYLNHGEPTAGIKWIASFPDNINMGMDRASAVIILNSASTGRPEALLEGSIISAKRTAASAALGAKYLHADKQVGRVGLIGCGLINFEILRFLFALYTTLNEVLLLDTDEGRAFQFKEKCRKLRDVEVRIVRDINTILSEANLVSFATTTVTPHVFGPLHCSPTTTILHISLRDLSPETVLHCDNVVDDIDHVCRAQTSVHLAEQLTGNRDFIRCTLADVTLGSVPARKNSNAPVVFSPFGLGILDIAVGRMVYNLAGEKGQGTLISSFLPESWVVTG